jgi:hypothetical protein
MHCVGSTSSGRISAISMLVTPTHSDCCTSPRHVTVAKMYAKTRSAVIALHVSLPQHRWPICFCPLTEHSLALARKAQPCLHARMNCTAARLSGRMGCGHAAAGPCACDQQQLRPQTRRNQIGPVRASHAGQQLADVWAPEELAPTTAISCHAPDHCHPGAPGYKTAGPTPSAHHQQ